MSSRKYVVRLHKLKLRFGIASVGEDSLGGHLKVKHTIQIYLVLSVYCFTVKEIHINEQHQLFIPFIKKAHNIESQEYFFELFLESLVYRNI